MKRMGMVIRLKTDKIQEYKRLHAECVARCFEKL